MFYFISFMIRTTDVFHDISQTVLWVWGWSSWLRTISFTCSMFSSLRALRGQSQPWCLSTVPVSLSFLNNLLMLLVDHPLSWNSVLNCLALHLFKWYKLFIWILSLSLKTMFTNNAVTSSSGTSDCRNKYIKVLLWKCLCSVSRWNLFCFKHRKH